MRDELAALVASASGPATVDEMLREAMAQLRADYPGGLMHAVDITFAACQRDGEPETREIHWRVQVNNESASGECSSKAFKKLAELLEEAAAIPPVAERVAALLRDVSDEHWARERVISRARNILDNERK